MTKPSKDVLGLPIEKRAEIAFKIAVTKAVDEHARLGLPVYIGRDGKVVELSADEVRLRLAVPEPEILRSPGKGSRRKTTHRLSSKQIDSIIKSARHPPERQRRPR